MLTEPISSKFNELSSALPSVIRELYTAPDRCSAVVAGAFLDHALELALTHLYRDDPAVNKALKNDYVSLGKKIQLLKSRLPLEEEIYSDLDLVRQIRNRFSHWYLDETFDTDPIGNWCASLKTWKRDKSEPSLPRDRFMSSIHYLCTRILVEVMLRSSHQ
jgi:hypothetical protein